MTDDLHELSALYALDVLDRRRARRGSRRTSPSASGVASELGGLRDAASALAFVDGPGAAGRLCAGASSTRRGPSHRTSCRFGRVAGLATPSPRCVAVAASAAAVGFGIWAATLHHSLAQERAATNVLRDPHARHIAVAGRAGRAGRRAVRRRCADRAPAEAAVGQHVRSVGREPDGAPAGVFTGGVVKLERRVPRGAHVMVTLERAGGTTRRRSSRCSAHARDPSFNCARMHRTRCGNVFANRQTLRTHGV